MIKTDCVMKEILYFDTEVPWDMVGAAGFREVRLEVWDSTYDIIRDLVAKGPIWGGTWGSLAPYIF